jgi:hypothetical protein
MKKIIYAFLMLTLFVSCENEDHGVDVNNYNGTSVTYFTAGTAGTYYVSDISENFKIQIGSTEKNSADRTYQIQVDPESTATQGVDFSLASSTVTIPAGSYFGEIEVVGIAAGASTDGTNLILNIVGNESNPVMVNTQYNLLVVLSCPIVAPFTGDYLIEELTPFVDGPTLDDGSIVTVYSIDGQEFQRGFMTANFVLYCSTPTQFLFELNCGKVLIPSPGNQSNCSCSGNLFFTDATTPSTYDSTDDSVFEVTFTNDAFSDCGSPAQTTYRFTKQ